MPMPKLTDKQLVDLARPLIEALADPSTVDKLTYFNTCPYCRHSAGRAIAEENKHNEGCPILAARKWLKYKR